MRDPFNAGGRPDPREVLGEVLGEARRVFREQARGARGGHRGHGEGRGHGGHFGPPEPPEPPQGPGFGPGFGPGGFGPAFFGPGGFGGGFGFGGGRGRGRGRGHRHSTPGRARRGNVRAAVLKLLAERPMHGYEMIQEITERSGGWWRPSPGSVYPTLQMLADEGLVTTEQQSSSGKRLYSLTEAGTAAAAELDATPPWEGLADDGDANFGALREAAFTLLGAATQVGATGNQEQRASAVKILNEARRKLYLLLAETADEAPVEDAVPDED